MPATRGNRARRVRLASGGEITLLSRIDIAQLSADDLVFVARILDTIGRYEQERDQRAAVSVEIEASLARWSDDGGAPCRA